MKIKVSEANKNKIGAVLAGVQYGTTTRTVTPDEVIDITAYIEEKLNIPKVDLVGVTVDVDMYAGIDGRRDIDNIPPMARRSTQFTLTYYPSGWFLIDVRRRVPGPHRYRIQLTPEAKWAVLYYNYKSMD